MNDDLKEITIETRFKTTTIPLDNIPILDIGSKIGDTGYIDFLKWEDVEYPIMKGIDILKRPFIVIKTIIDNTLFMETYFKRHNKPYSSWHCSGKYTNTLITTYGGMNAQHALYVKSLIEKGEVTILEEHTDYKIFIGKKIKIYDEKKWNAAKIIQNQFRKCRYDPSYKMCTTIQINNLNRILKENNRQPID